MELDLESMTETYVLSMEEKSVRLVPLSMCDSFMHSVEGLTVPIYPQDPLEGV